MNEESNQKINKKDYIWHIVLIAIIFILLFISMKCLNNIENVDKILNFKYIATTFAIWTSGYLILKGLTNKTKISIIVIATVESIYDIINYVVIMARGSAITISDIYAIRTAISVSKNLRIHFNIQFYLGILFAILVLALIIIFRKKFIEKKTNIIFRFLKILIGIITIIILQNSNIYKNENLWDINNNYRELGTPITLLRMMEDFNVAVPKEYNKEEVANVLKQYEKDNNIEVQDKPNIIVIINESFCDYYNLYKDGNADSIEYFTELSKSENVVSGVMYSSEIGGGTANVEYEFLTQNSYRILPVGAYMFQQYISSPVKSSIVQNLKEQGYKTSAMHPWESYAYSRNKIYKLFGFDSIKFKDDIEGLEANFNNEFYTDRSTYKELLKEINEKKEDEKLFSYVLTVQNHTGYNTPDKNQLTYNEKNNKNVYMQLIHESSEAFKDLIEELKNKDEKYILMFFGDHQPSLEDDFEKEKDTVEKYQVPFIIWANYDIEEKYNITTSTVFAQNYLLESANVKFSAMNNFMQELKEYYPVITKKFYMDKEGNLYKDEDDKSENISKMEEYYKISYYRMFDEK